MLAEGEYEELVQLLVDHGLVELCSTASAAVQGVFGVPKGDRARLILNAKAANALCEVPPDPQLPLIESLVKLIVPPGERLHLSLLDLSDYYHGLLLPSFLRELFGLPVVMVDGVEWFPRWVTLPMGFSWAVYLAQLAHVHTLRSRSPLYAHSIDLVGPAIPRVLTPGESVASTYIDDVLGISLERERSVRLIQEVKAVEVSEVREEKLQLAQEGVGVKAWGIELDEHRVFRPPRDRLHALVVRTQWCLAQGVLRTTLLQSLVGKWLWFAMLCRPLLSTFSPLFRQARCRRPFVKLWPSTCRSLRQLIAVSPLIEVVPSSPVGWVVATDASTTGGGVVLSEHYCLECLKEVAPLCYYKGRDDLTSTGYRESVGTWVQGVEFTSGFAWRWRDDPVQEHITVKEARALWAGIRRVVLHSRVPLNARHLLLVDNIGVVGAFSKGRSSNPVVNSLITRTASLRLLTGFNYDIIWCPTLYQPADRASRKYGGGDQ